MLELEEGAKQVKVNATLAEKTGTTVHHRKTNPGSIKRVVSMLTLHSSVFSNKSG